MSIDLSKAQIGEDKIIYLSGPMSGYPDFNYPLFHAVTGELRRLGHRVYNPAEFPHDGPPETFPIRAAFAAYSSFICLEAQVICLLPGWEKSMGASAEIALAKNCKLQVVDLTVFIFQYDEELQ